MNNYRDKIYVNAVKKPNGLFRFLNLGLICFTILILALILSAADVYSAQVKLGWDPNPEVDIAGYKIYYINTASINDVTIDDVGNVTTHTVSGLVNGATYFMVLTAYDTSLNESGFSNGLIYSVPLDNTGSTADEAQALLNLTLSKDSAVKSVLPEYVVVTVQDQNGNPMPNIVVNATTNGKGAIVYSNSVKTYVNGMALFRFRFKLTAEDGEIVFSVGSSHATLRQVGF